LLDYWREKAMNLLKITLKPALRIKTKKGKHYIQIKNADGDLIHIGPASDVDSWRIASSTLENEYKTILMTERAMLIPLIKREGLSVKDALTPICESHIKWMAYIEKCNKKFDERQIKIAELEKGIGQRFPETPWELRPVLENIRKKKRNQISNNKSV
jgi:hypothetical protein